MATDFPFFIWFTGVNAASSSFLETAMTPLCKKPASERRPFTVAEEQAFQNMTSSGPKIYMGAVPFEGPEFPDVIQVDKGTYLGVPYVTVRYNNSTRLHTFSLFMRFRSERSAFEFIRYYKIEGTGDKVRALLTGNRNKPFRRMKAHKIQLKEALVWFYNARGNGITVGALRRRGLVCKLMWN